MLTPPFILVYIYTIIIKKPGVVFFQCRPLGIVFLAFTIAVDAVLDVIVINWFLVDARILTFFVCVSFTLGTGVILILYCVYVNFI